MLKIELQKYIFPMMTLKSSWMELNQIQQFCKSIFRNNSEILCPMQGRTCPVYLLILFFILIFQPGSGKYLKVELKKNAMKAQGLMQGTYNQSSSTIIGRPLWTMVVFIW